MRDEYVSDHHKKMEERAAERRFDESVYQNRGLKELNETLRELTDKVGLILENLTRD